MAHQSKAFCVPPISVHPCDVYSDWGVIINYTANGIVEAVELCSPETAILDGDDLLRLDYAQLQLRLAQGGEVSEDAGSLTSLPLGIGGYAPDAAKRKKAKLQSVIAFAQGYYR